jgi:rubrerythrin
VKLHRAILLALAAPSCSSDGPPGSPDGTVEDAPFTSDAEESDAITDARADGNDGSPNDVQIPIYDGGTDPSPPDGCVITGKPGADVFVPCDVYVELLNSAAICGAVIDAGDAQPPIVCETLCDPTQIDCWYQDLGDGGIMSCGECGGGRLHRAARARAAIERRARVGPSVGEWFAHAAFLEATAVDAFRILAGDLRQHGAPPSLRRAARRAVTDETRHARAMRGLAARFGVRGKVPPIAPSSGPRSLVAVATENAVEGCVCETFGAALVAWQARHARDRSVRRAMRTIARDELRHAELAWAIAAWMDEKLTRSERAAVRAARNRAIADLERSLGTMRGNEQLGLPDTRSAEPMLASLRSTTLRVV